MQQQKVATSQSYIQHQTSAYYQQNAAHPTFYPSQHSSSHYQQMSTIPNAFCTQSNSQNNLIHNTQQIKLAPNTNPFIYLATHDTIPTPIMREIIIIGRGKISITSLHIKAIHSVGDYLWKKTPRSNSEVTVYEKIKANKVTEWEKWIPKQVESHVNSWKKVCYYAPPEAALQNLIIKNQKNQALKKCIQQFRRPLINFFAAIRNLYNINKLYGVKKCPWPNKQISTAKSKQICFRCGKANHSRYVCHSKIDINGKSLLPNDMSCRFKPQSASSNKADCSRCGRNSHSTAQCGYFNHTVTNCQVRQQKLTSNNNMMLPPKTHNVFMQGDQIHQNKMFRVAPYQDGNQMKNDGYFQRKFQDIDIEEPARKKQKINQIQCRHPKPGNNSRKKCKFYPNCKQGDDCGFFHPKCDKKNDNDNYIVIKNEDIDIQVMDTEKIASERVVLKCANCNVDLRNKDIWRCSKCKTALYCDKKCQLDHWKTHKMNCGESMLTATFAKDIIKIERVSVHEWNHYAIVYWLNRVTTRFCPRFCAECLAKNKPK